MEKLRVVEWVGAATICIPISLMGSFAAATIFLPIYQLVGFAGQVVLFFASSVCLLAYIGFVILTTPPGGLLKTLELFGVWLVVLDYVWILEYWPYSIRFPWLGGIGIFLIMMRYLIPIFMKEWKKAKET